MLSKKLTDMKREVLEFLEQGEEGEQTFWSREGAISSFQAMVTDDLVTVSASGDRMITEKGKMALKVGDYPSGRY